MYPSERIRFVAQWFTIIGLLGGRLVSALMIDGNHGVDRPGCGEITALACATLPYAVGAQAGQAGVELLLHPGVHATTPLLLSNISSLSVRSVRVANGGMITGSHTTCPGAPRIVLMSGPRFLEARDVTAITLEDIVVGGIEGNPMFVSSAAIIVLRAMQVRMSDVCFAHVRVEASTTPQQRTRTIQVQWFCGPGSTSFLLACHQQRAP